MPEYTRRFDRASWRSFKLSEGGSAILTARGMELLYHNKPLRVLLREYRDEARHNTIGKVRKYFRPGGNSTVYKLADTEILIKEGERKGRPPLWNALDRMDYLYGICLQYLDPYVRVPDHYALFSPANSDQEYLMMRKINNGVTVEDVQRGRVSVEDRVREEVNRDFSTLKERVREVINISKSHKQIPYRNLIPDWTPANVLVDLHTRPVNKPYTLWIIDQ